MKVDVVSLAAEFPNDNPALHRGVSWVCLGVTGLPVPIPPVPEAGSVPSMSFAELITASEPVAELAFESLAEVPEARVSEIVELGTTPRDELELELILDLDEPFLVEDALPPCDDPWTLFVSALADVALGAGSPHVASVLPALLLEGKVDTMPDEAVAALAEADVVRDGAVTPAFVARMNAWRAILLGTSDDFEACGGAMLDEWAAELLARLLGAPSRATLFRRELRSRGVAAFGLVEAA